MEQKEITMKVMFISIRIDITILMSREHYYRNNISLISYKYVLMIQLIGLFVK